jgi:predicted Zn-dependent peptidase
MVNQRYHETRIKNGLRIIAAENANSPIATIGIWLRAGSRYGDNSEEAYPHLLEHLMFDGTKKRPSRSAVSETADRLGAYLNAFTGRERVSFVAQVVRDYAAEMFELLADMVMQPLLTAEALEIEKKVIIEEIRRAQENIQRRLLMLGLKEFFGNHPLARDTLGTIEDVSTATREGVERYYRKFYSPARCAIVVIGRFKLKEAFHLAEKYFGAWNSSAPIVESNAAFTLRSNYFFQENASPRTALMLNFPAPPAPDLKSHAALHLVANYLGYGQSSVLKQEIRVKRGLVYDLQVGATPFSDAGYFYVETATQKPVEVLALILEHVARLKNALNPRLMEQIKLQTILAFQRKMADPFAEHEFLGHGFILHDRLFSPAEYISALSNLAFADLIETIESCLAPSNSFLAALGSEDKGIKRAYEAYLGA